MSITKLLYGDFRTKVICGQYLTEDFEIKTGAKQGCIPFLFCLEIDWVMKETALGDKGGIKWTFTETLDDIDFADDISSVALLRRHSKKARNLPEMRDPPVQEQRTEYATICGGIMEGHQSHMLKVFQNKCLRKTLQIYWPNKISNTELHERTGMQPISLEVKRCRNGSVMSAECR